MIPTSNAHGGAATPESWRSHVVAMYAAEALKFDHNADASHTSNRPEPVASNVVPFDCLRGGETR
jgi:hypothetical protein